MALITCPECKKEISSLANECPNCGFPLKKKSDIPMDKVRIIFPNSYKTYIIETVKDLGFPIGIYPCEIARAKAGEVVDISLDCSRELEIKGSFGFLLGKDFLTKRCCIPGKKYQLGVNANRKWELFDVE